MNIIFSLLTGPVLIFLFILALIAFFFPVHFISFKNKYPAIYYAILILALLMQFPLLFSGCWGLGMQYAESKLSKIVDISYICLIGMYIIFFFSSLAIQGKKKEIERLSLGTALFISLILSPLLHLVFMVALTKILLGK